MNTPDYIRIANCTVAYLNILKMNTVLHVNSNFIKKLKDVKLILMLYFNPIAKIMPCQNIVNMKIVNEIVLLSPQNLLFMSD